MPQKINRTFLDACVLMTAYHANRELHEKALALLRDESRDFLSSSIVELELTQAQYDPSHKEEADSYIDYFQNVVTERLDITEALVVQGIETVRRTQCTAADAMHLTCAIQMNADEFITAEKPGTPQKPKGSPMYREGRVPVIYLGNL